jgi:prepilin-type N-terminal cleavage/methylation domain-containing protein
MVTKTTDQRGFTLVEILIAVAVIGIGLMALSSAIPIAAYGIQEGNQLSTATFLANQRLEQVRNAEWKAAQPPVAAVDTLGVSASDATAPVGDGGGTTFSDETPMEAPFKGYTRTVRIADCGVAPGCSGIVDAGLRQVTVTVGYQPMTGVGLAPATTIKSVIVTMYIAKR